MEINGSEVKNMTPEAFIGYNFLLCFCIPSTLENKLGST